MKNNRNEGIHERRRENTKIGSFFCCIAFKPKISDKFFNI